MSKVLSNLVSLSKMTNLDNQAQQRIDLLESHYREWSETLIAEAEMQCTLEDQQRQKIIQFASLDLMPPVNIEWLALMDQQSQEREEFLELNRVKRHLIRNRHKAEMLKLTASLEL